MGRSLVSICLAGVGECQTCNIRGVLDSSTVDSSSLSLSLSALVGSTAPHPAGELGWSDGLENVLGEVWATAL